ncbi:D-alanyl-D-alanine carboxypeptidase family protein [Demequina sp.]|uniref:D-alanyl-D-alanine carboxypeptidase family protein n=1 Tax=Demequina sp. TaxID=2050685 RepID=UPI003A892A0A
MPRAHRAPTAPAARTRRRAATYTGYGLVGVGLVAGAWALWGDGAPEPADASALPTVTVTAQPTTTPAPTVGAVTAPEAATPSPTATAVGRITAGIDLTQHSIDDPASIWVVVNKRRGLEPEGFTPDDLVAIEGQQMTAEAAQAMTDMRAAASEQGHSLNMGTAYRPFGFQQSIYQDYVSTWGQTRADRFSARPGHSEHQTGLAADLYSSQACRLKECFGEEPAGQWLAQHAHEYGFIIRYLQGTEEVTGYRYEPWHVRYVGVELATSMHDEGITAMEEVFGLDPAPDYE